jgi:hypothetical protein
MYCIQYMAMHNDAVAGPYSCRLMMIPFIFGLREERRLPEDR